MSDRRTTTDRVPRALDLFCGAGGATRGLQAAGFHVTGVDLHPQPRYVGDVFVQGNALEWTRRLSAGWNAEPHARFDFVWASPPCQAFSAYRRRGRDKVGATALNLIPEVRNALSYSGIPFVLENVPGAPLINPCVLCGSMFGLEVRRHRLFEARGFEIPALPCNHDAQQGSFPQATNRRNRRKTVEVGVYRIPLEVQKRAMGVSGDITLGELSQAIPPAYAEHIGRAFLAARACRAA